jgi:hypothetical protein
MVCVDTAVWRWLETRSATLFLIAGMLTTIYATAHGIEAAMAMVLEPNPFEFGYVVGFLGLLGLYPTLAGRSPWLARVGAMAAVLGAVALSAFTLIHLADLVGLVSSDPAAAPSWFGVFKPLALIGFVGGYLALGIASLRADVYSRTVGLLLLAPGIIVVWMIWTMVAGYADELTAFVVSAGEAMAHLALGVTLRTESSATDRAESATDADREPVAHD